MSGQASGARELFWQAPSGARELFWRAASTARTLRKQSQK